jgi:endonuclease G
VLSYNESRGTPNWVSYELDARQFGKENRCNCFSADPNLPADKQIFTSNYTMAATIADT